MLAVYFSVFLAFFLSLRAVDAQFMATEEDAMKAINIYMQFGCSADSTNQRISDSIACQKESDIEFYNRAQKSGTDGGQCAAKLTDQSTDNLNIRFCRSLKSDTDPDSVEGSTACKTQ